MLKRSAFKSLILGTHPTCSGSQLHETVLSIGGITEPLPNIYDSDHCYHIIENPNEANDQSLQEDNWILSSEGGISLRIDNVQTENINPNSQVDDNAEFSIEKTPVHTTRRRSKTTNSAVRELTEFKKITSGKEHELRMEQMKEEHKLKMKVLNEQLEVFKTVKNILMTNPSSLHLCIGSSHHNHHV